MKDVGRWKIFSGRDIGNYFKFFPFVNQVTNVFFFKMTLLKMFTSENEKCLSNKFKTFEEYFGNVIFDSPKTFSI